MSLDHDLENLLRLSDEDHEALDNPSSSTSTSSIDETIRHRVRVAAVKPKSFTQRINAQRDALFGAMAMLASMRDSFSQDDYHPRRVLEDAYQQVDAVAGALEELGTDFQALMTATEAGHA